MDFEDTLWTVLGTGLILLMLADVFYYFHEVEQRGSLPATIAYAHELASDAQGNENPELRFAGRMLKAALDDLAEVLRGKFGHAGSTSSAVFDSYELHHKHRQPRGLGFQEPPSRE